MKLSPSIIPLAVHVAVFVGTALIAAYASASTAAEPARERELIRLVRQDCGSCHGLQLSGGLGPALLPTALADKPEEALVATVLNGRPGSAMPGWSRFMDETEATWVVRALITGFPEDKETRR